MNLADAALEDLSPDSPVINDLKQILANSNKMAAITQKLNNLHQLSNPGLFRYCKNFGYIQFIQRPGLI